MDSRLIVFWGILFQFMGCQIIAQKLEINRSIFRFGAIERLDTTQKVILLTFTGGDFAEGTMFVRNTLKEQKILANFFFTGDFYREKKNKKVIRRLIRDGHYLGAHSDKHLLYAAWENRDSLLVTEEEFLNDLIENYRIMGQFGLRKDDIRFFIPPYEWYNDSISNWTAKMGLQLFNFTPGTRSNADYTTPDMGKRYVESETIMQSILDFENRKSSGLNGFILLLHVGTDPLRKDKFYYRLAELVQSLKKRGYLFSTFRSVE